MVLGLCMAVLLRSRLVSSGLLLGCFVCVVLSVFSAFVWLLVWFDACARITCVVVALVAVVWCIVVSGLWSELVGGGILLDSVSASWVSMVVCVVLVLSALVVLCTSVVSCIVSILVGLTLSW